MQHEQIWRSPALDASVARGYLARLGQPDPGQPTVAALHDLHARHVERIPYETVWIHLGERLGLDPVESARRVSAGRGGYCYHLNGALSVLLTTLGYDVHWHIGGVQRRGVEPPGADGNHLVLSVHGLPDEKAPDGTWYVDVGLGDALHKPLALRSGVARQGGFTYALGPSDVVAGGWRFVHDPRGGFEAMDFAPGPADPAAFSERHRWLSTSPESGFVRVLIVQRRDATGVDVLRGCVLNRVSGTDGGWARDVTSYDDWTAALDGCGLSLDDIPTEAVRELWRRTRAAHDRWDAAGRP